MFRGSLFREPVHDSPAMVVVLRMPSDVFEKMSTKPTAGFAMIPMRPIPMPFATPSAPSSFPFLTGWTTTPVSPSKMFCPKLFSPRASPCAAFFGLSYTNDNGNVFGDVLYYFIFTVTLVISLSFAYSLSNVATARPLPTVSVIFAALLNRP